MKYFIDTEFIEGFHKPLFGKRRHFIDLISIGIVAEDGRTYYAISKEYEYDKASDWVKENIITPLYLSTVNGDQRNQFTIENFHKYYGLSHGNIAEGIKRFCDPTLFLHNTAEPNIDFYAYYADYDWVVFCSLFGRMIDLPKGFPMYCRDLKQMFDEKYPADLRKDIRNLPYYPKQTDEHNALADAKWNKELYKFLTV
jgi:hypothetical protein